MVRLYLAAEGNVFCFGSSHTKTNCKKYTHYADWATPHSWSVLFIALTHIDLLWAHSMLMWSFIRQRLQLSKTDLNVALMVLLLPSLPLYGTSEQVMFVTALFFSITERQKVILTKLSGRGNSSKRTRSLRPQKCRYKPLQHSEENAQIQFSRSEKDHERGNTFLTVCSYLYCSNYCGGECWVIIAAQDYWIHEHKPETAELCIRYVSVVRGEGSNITAMEVRLLGFAVKL